MTFACPLCHADVDERFYGPCAECREQLHELESPPRDLRFQEAFTQTGARYSTYVGPFDYSAIRKVP